MLDLSFDSEAFRRAMIYWFAYIRAQKNPQFYNLQATSYLEYYLFWRDRAINQELESRIQIEKR